MSPDRDFPTIDAHAHIAPDVTGPQLKALGNTIVFAMTRSLTEARAVYNRDDKNLVWGLGTHPGVAAALNEYDEDKFAKALEHFAVVGEVGLDRRGQIGHQREVFTSILQQCKNRPVIISVHSTGRIRDVLDIVSREPHPGLILHWFNGTRGEIEQAADLGCYFSINGAMEPQTVAAMPFDRILTETDFPSSRRRTGASNPGDTKAAEELFANVSSDTNARNVVRRNLKTLLDASGAEKRLGLTAI